MPPRPSPKQVFEFQPTWVIVSTWGNTNRRGSVADVRVPEEDDDVPNGLVCPLVPGLEALVRTFLATGGEGKKKCKRCKGTGAALVYSSVPTMPAWIKCPRCKPAKKPAKPLHERLREAIALDDLKRLVPAVKKAAARKPAKKSARKGGASGKA